MMLTWGVSSGSLVNFTKRSFYALDVALHDCLKWPTTMERHQIQLEFSKLRFPNCIGLIDGTLLPLLQRPKVSRECYFNQKSCYSVNAQVIWDPQRKLFSFTLVFASDPTLSIVFLRSSSISICYCLCMILNNACSTTWDSRNARFLC